MTISEVMKRTGLTRKAIYLYEDRGLLVPKKDGGFREYTEDDVCILTTIARLRKLNVSLQDVAMVLRNDIGIDILLYQHLTREQQQLNDMVNTIALLNTVIYNLPPHSTISDFECAADAVLPRKMGKIESDKLENEYPKGYTRRLAMQLYEAFLDVPLDTPERWEAWYALLEDMENSRDERIFDAHDEYYGTMTTGQIYEDYGRRREHVCAYPHYNDSKMRLKADEIISELGRLVNDAAARKQWVRYYQKIVRPMSRWQRRRDNEYLRILSNVYHSYHGKFNEIDGAFIQPYLKTDEGKALMQSLRHTCGTTPEDDSIWLVYFDFYNNTIRRVLYPELTKE